MLFMLEAQDMDRAVAFWRDVVGLTEKVVSPEWSELGYGDAVIALHGGGDGQVHQSGLGFGVADIDAACKDVLQAGGQIRMWPQDRPDEGIRLADCVDTEGNTFMFSAPLQG